MLNNSCAFPQVPLHSLVQSDRRITYGIVQPGNFVEDGVILVRGGDYSSGWVTIERYKRVTAEIDAPYRRSKLRGGDLVMTIVGANTGTVAVVPDWLEGANITQTTARIAVDPTKAIPGFVEQVLRSSIGQDEVFKYQKGGAQPGLNLSDIEKFILPLPPLPEQRKIASVLGTWDDAISTSDQIITLLVARRDALRSKLIREGELDAKKVTFGTFLTESRLSGTDGATARKITVKLYGKGAIAKDDKRNGSVTTRYYSRRARQLIYSKLDFLNGAFALLPDELDGFESTLDLPAFDISDDVNPKWLIEYLCRPIYYENQIHLARGQRKARRVAPEEFLASPLHLPSRKLQDKMANVIFTADQEIRARQNMVEALKRQKSGLMQKLLQGEWRVRLDGKKEAAA